MSINNGQSKRLVSRQQYFDSYDRIYRKPCEPCRGSGDIGNKLIGYVKCPKCNGKGKVPKNE